MPTNNQQLTIMLDRSIQAAQELRANAVALANLEADIKRAQSELAGLESRIAEAKPLAAEVDGIEKHLRSRKAELDALQNTISMKQVEHGSIDAALQGLMKRTQKLVGA